MTVYNYERHKLGREVSIKRLIDNGQSATEASKEIGISRPVLQKVEEGVQQTRADTILKVLIWLDKKPSDFGFYIKSKESK